MITLKLETIDNNLLDYKLTLSRDSTFNYYSNIKNGIPEINKYGKGNGLWKTCDFIDKQDIDDKIRTCNSRQDL
jgi:hypothetical protein